MAQVVSLVPVERFQAPGAVIPDKLDFVFETDLSEAAVILACRTAAFLFVPANYPPITARILENIPSIRMVQSHGTGYDKIDVEAAARLMIPVANVPGENSMTVAEFTIALIVSLQRRIVVSDREIKAGRYSAARKRSLACGLNEIGGCRLGILGMGSIGRLVARIAGLLGAEVAYCDLNRADPALEAELNLEYLPLDQLLSASNIISLHVPYTERTKGLIGEKEIALMPPGSLLINTSRGEVVDPNALAQALERGHLGAAALDTVSPEPPPPDHPLLNLSEEARDKVILTPHIAGVTARAFGRLLTRALANMMRVVEAKQPLNVVNGIFQARLGQ